VIGYDKQVNTPTTMQREREKREREREREIYAGVDGSDGVH